MQEVLQNLNKNQLDAVLYNDGPLLLLAGAGTGKTRVLTSKIAYIIKNKMAFPSEILAVTFTNKATNEMKERVENITGLNVDAMWINTFHSTATRILRQYGEMVGINKDFNIISQTEQITLVKQIIKDLNIESDIEDEKVDVKEYVSLIGKLKNKTKSSLNIGILLNKLPKFSEVYDLYHKKLKQINSCDFDDLILNNIKLFKEQEEVKKYFNEKFKYILVDEYQDTNVVQHEWLKLISGIDKNKNVCITCVGDDDQSIYGWRGAEITHILKFTNDYTEAKIMKLEKNYRSTKNILDAASKLIANNKKRHEKSLYSAIENTNGEKIKLIVCNNSKQEASIIAEEIIELMESKKIKSYKDIAILVRASYQTRVFEEIFLKCSLPYKIVGNVRFYERAEIKDCLAYLKLANNPCDDLSFERIINTPKRGIGTITINKIRNFANTENISMFKSAKYICNEGEIKGKTKDEIIHFINYVEEWNENINNNLKLSNLMEKILSKTGYRQQLENSNNIEDKNKIENIEEFINGLDEFDTVEEFLEHVSLVNDENSNNTSETVNIMTIHAAKGLEFYGVFLPNWQEGVFPSPKSMEEDRLEEERRLAYVSITRAKNLLYISYSKTRFECGEIIEAEPSRFVSELPKECLENIDKNTDYYTNYSNYIYNDYKNKNYYSNYNNKYNNDYYRGYSNSDTKIGKTKQNSIIIDDECIIETNYTAMNKTKKCFHKTFGNGYIIGENGNKLTIVFENCGKKIILKDFVKIEG